MFRFFGSWLPPKTEIIEKLKVIEFMTDNGDDGCMGYIATPITDECRAVVGMCDHQVKDNHHYVKKKSR